VLLSGLCLLLAITSQSSMTWTMVFFTLAGGAYYAFHPAFWAIPTELLSESAAAAAIGFINSVGNLGGFVGPFIVGMFVAKTKSFDLGLWYLVGSFFISGILMLAVGSGWKRPRPESALAGGLSVRPDLSTAQN
jgi:ACS family tartrate transporter-like MFS transporter